MNKKNNLRFQENETIMIDVFVELLKRKEFNKISVKDICEQSLVNRSTFYAHFQDMYELKEHTEHRFEKELLESLKDYVVDGIDHKQMFSILIQEIKKKKDFYKVYFNGLGYSRMKSGFQTLIETRFNVSQDKKPNKFIEYQYTFFFDGMIAILARWLNHDCDLNENELVNLLYEYWPQEENM